MIDTNESYLEKERRLFRRAVWAASLLHAAVLAVVVWAARPEPVNPFQTLAVVSFAHFDPEGGEPGGGDSDEAAEAPVAALEAEPAPEAEAAPEPGLEPELEPEAEDESEKIESVSEKAAPLPLPKEPELKSKPKPKPAARPEAAPGPAEIKTATIGAPGGGPGQGRGGLGGGSGQGNPDELNAYLAQVRKRLAASKKYPPTARARKLEGVARVSFLLAPDGRVLSSNLARSSGHAVLDDEVMALVRRVSPLPPRPQGLPQDNLSLTVPIQFSLR
jgi:protein TonB